MKGLDLSIALWVAGGSAIGGVLRYACSGWIARWVGETYPWGTLFVNVVGSLLIGLIAALTAAEGRLYLDPHIRQFLMLGIFGGFTTFSSFSLQTLNLVQDGEYLYASSYVAASVVFCLIAVWAGYALGIGINR